MAKITYNIPDQQIINYVKSTYDLDPGKNSGTISVDVLEEPFAENNYASHVIEVTLRYPVPLGEVQKLIEL